MSSIKAQVKYSFEATNAHELTIRAGQTIYIAPTEIQNTQKLRNTGWALATLDHQTSGIIPLDYVERPQHQQQPIQQQKQMLPTTLEEPSKIDEAAPVMALPSPFNIAGGSSLQNIEDIL